MYIVPEYRGHCSKSSQLGLRPRCLDGPWIRNCTSWYAAKTSGASTIIIQSKYTMINIHLLIFYGAWQVSKAFYSSASYHHHHFLSSRICLQSCQGELLVWMSSWIGFSSQWLAWMCSPGNNGLVVVCLSVWWQCWGQWSQGWWLQRLWWRGHKQCWWCVSGSWCC